MQASYSLGAVVERQQIGPGRHLSSGFADVPEWVNPYPRLLANPLLRLCGSTAQRRCVKAALRFGGFVEGRIAGSTNLQISVIQTKPFCASPAMPAALSCCASSRQWRLVPSGFHR
jgi:hypothetical protein